MQDQSRGVYTERIRKDMHANTYASLVSFKLTPLIVLESLRYTFWKLRVLQNLEVHVGVSRLPFLVKIQVHGWH